MATRIITFKANISDELLEKIANKNEYLDSDQGISAVNFATVKVLGRDFINDTIRRIVDVKQNELLPVDLIKYRNDIEIQILGSTQVFIDDQLIYNNGKTV